MRQSFARKVIHPFSGKGGEEDIENEIRAINKLCSGQHENIVHVYGHGRLGPNSRYYCIDMELCTLNLEEYIQGKITEGLRDWRRPSQREDLLHVLGIMEQVMSGLSYIHRENEVHRDLNPQNGIIWLVTKSLTLFHSTLFF